MHNNLITKIVFTASLILLSHIASAGEKVLIQAYPGPKKPKAQVAYIYYCYAKRIDYCEAGKKGGYVFWEFSREKHASTAVVLAVDKTKRKNNTHGFEVLPGKHSLYIHNFKTRKGTLARPFLDARPLKNARVITLNFEAGHSYMVYGSFWPSRNWITDMTSQKVVYGTRRVSSNSPLHIAIREGNFDEVKRLIKAGADINAKVIGGGNIIGLGSPKDFTPLHMASIFGRTEIVTYLVSKGAELNPLDIYGLTPLFYAVRKNRVETAKVLIGNGADLNRGGYQIPLLIWALKFKRKPIAEALVKHGADLTVKDNKGRSAFYWAKKRRMKTIVAMFETRGVRE